MHRLAAQFPDLRFVLNGGLETLEQVDAHLGLPSPDGGGGQWLEEGGGGAEGGSLLHGCMLGRAAYTDPFLLAGADSRYFGAAEDQDLTRGGVLASYYDYCDRVMWQEPEEEQAEGLGQGGSSGVKVGELLDATKNLFHGCAGASRYRQRLKSLCAEQLHSRRSRRSDFVHPQQAGEEEEGAVGRGPDPVRMVREHTPSQSAALLTRVSSIQPVTLSHCTV